MYHGEVDSDGKACGNGKLIGPGIQSYKGTFFNNFEHGMGKFTPKYNFF